MGRSRRALLGDLATGWLAATAGCLDPFPGPPEGSIVVTNRDDEPHEVTLASGDRERTVALGVGRQVVVTSMVEGTDELRVRLDGGTWQVVPATDGTVHLVVDAEGRLSVADRGNAAIPEADPGRTRLR